MASNICQARPYSWHGSGEGSDERGGGSHRTGREQHVAPAGAGICAAAGGVGGGSGAAERPAGECLWFLSACGFCLGEVAAGGVEAARGGDGGGGAAREHGERWAGCTGEVDCAGAGARALQ